MEAVIESGMTNLPLDDQLPASRMRRFVIRSKGGLHLRVALKITESLAGLDCKVILVGRTHTADCKSILDLLTVAAAENLIPEAEIDVEAFGPDADAALAVLALIFADPDL